MKKGLTRSAALAAVALVAAVPLAACGKSDEDEIRDLIELGNKQDPKVCDKVTDKWLREVTEGDKAECERDVKEDEDRFDVKKVSVDGDKATVDGTDDEGDSLQIFLVKEDGEWKLDGGRQTGAGSSGGGGGGGGDTADETQIRGTYQAFVDATKKENGAVFCGLISERYAAELLDRSGRFPRAECLQRSRAFNYGPLARALSRVRPGDVTVSGDSATLRLSDGETVEFTKEKDRWVIDDIES